MFAGNIGVAQDFPTILDAAVRLKHDEHIQWIIVGGGRNLSWVKDEVERRGLQQNVLLAGRFPADQMPRWFGCADVMLVTLSSDPIFARTLPAKIQAYMAASKPIIAALSGEGARLIGEANCGICAPAGDAFQLAEAVLKASQMSVADLQRLGANGRQFYVDNFERESVIDKLEQLIRPIGV
jgi:glycosyltransferase involved in cell wall biosynthesis